MLVSEEGIAQQVRLALAEDIGDGDLTASLVPASQQSRAQVVCRETAVIAGRPWFDEVFKQTDSSISLDWYCAEGQQVPAGHVLCEIQGASRSLLTAERTALNFLQTLSAVATRTRRFVDEVKPLAVNILDTRKTLPGLRLAQKYAVTCGGGLNHRIGLYDAILIKENHIQAAGSISAALQQAAAIAGRAAWIEVEVETLQQLEEALAAGAQRILLDNFDLQQLSAAVQINAGRARLEASGNVELASIRRIAETGVNDISIGELTKTIQAVDLSMRFV